MLAVLRKRGVRRPTIARSVMVKEASAMLDSSSGSVAGRHDTARRDELAHTRAFVPSRSWKRVARSLQRERKGADNCAHQDVGR